MGILTAVGIATFLAAAPGGAAASGAGPGGSAALQVFAAASLADAFGEIVSEFERAHPGVTVRLDLGGSQQLATQIEQGAAADVFASADGRWIEYLERRSLLAGGPVVFARNRLALIVPRANPGRIARLQDLARPGVKLVIGAEAVPVGKYGREVLRRLSRTSGFDTTFAQRALANVVSEEENVKAVVGKVQLGEADAGICYRSDVTPRAARAVRVLAIPDSVNVLASYPIALLRGARQPGLAREFAAFVTSPRGQGVLERHGLIPAAASAP